MKTHFAQRNPQRGSALLASMIVIVVLSFAACAVLSYSLTTYRNSVRQAVLDQAKEIADSEMQYLYFTWKQDLLTKQAAPGLSVDQFLSAHAGFNATPGSAPPAAAPSPTNPSSVTSPGPAYNIAINLAPFSSIAQGLWNGGVWTVSRTLQFNPKTVVGSTSTDGSALGIMNGTNGSVGKIFYYTAKTRATFSSPIFGTIEFHSGRNFQFASSSLFQYALFYQGNLELAAGSTMTIAGPISTNASAYVGSTHGVLTLTSSIHYFQDYNGASDPTSGVDGRLEVQYMNPTENQTHVNNAYDGTSQMTTYNGILETSGAQPQSLNDPVFNPNPAATAPADQAAQRQLQVSQIVQQQNFVGGVDVQNALNNYQNAYLNPSSHLPDANEVYRAVIAPPPGVPEDPSVAASRMYNSAGVVITIAEDTTGATTVAIGTAAAPAAYYDPANPASGVITQAQYAKIIPAGFVRQQIVNKRELAGGTPALNATVVDIAGLNDALNTLMPGNAVSSAVPSYNGMVYVYDKTDNTYLVNHNPALSSLTNTQNAVVLEDGAVTPNFYDSNGNPYGFTVASNNGVYVQGDYNIKQINVDGTPVPNPAAIMGDSITAVSAYNSSTTLGWQPTMAYTSALLNTRVAEPTSYPIIPGQLTGTTYSASDQVTATDYADSLTGPPSGMTINAAILTGNTPSYVDPADIYANDGTSQSYSSGGAQNLVRMEEDWNANALTLVLQGSVGQLFSSDYVKAPYRTNGPWPGINPDGVPSHTDVIYQPPSTRLINYDTSFSVRTPFGAPTTSNFTIGPFFFW
jgi:hypothetical protein